MPRAGARNKASTAATSQDDSEIVITKKLTGGGSSVRIRIGGSARSPTENIQSVSDNWVEPSTGSGPAAGGKISRDTNITPRGESHPLD